MSAFSILIPTFNRKDKLQAVWERLLLQPRIVEGEIIIGVDGSSDGTVEWLESLLAAQDEKQVRLSYFKIENSGRSAIRNQLLDRARGEIIIFIQDDILVTEGWLAAHLEAQERQKGAHVGHVTWYPRQEITEYMKWLENGGHMLDFANLSPAQVVDYWHFYMGNISIPRDLLGDLRFDESISTYGWEDILFGHQFIKRGGQAYYNPTAKAYHWDEYLEHNLQDYMCKLAVGAVAIEQKYPELALVPPNWKKLIFWLMIGAGSWCRPFLSQRRRWYLNMKKWYLEACQAERERLSERLRADEKKGGE